MLRPTALIAQPCVPPGPGTAGPPGSANIFAETSGYWKQNPQNAALSIHTVALTPISPRFARATKIKENEPTGLARAFSCQTSAPNCDEASSPPPPAGS